MYLQVYLVMKSFFCVFIVHTHLYEIDQIETLHGRTYKWSEESE